MSDPKVIDFPPEYIQRVDKGLMINNRFQGAYIVGNVQPDNSCYIGRVGNSFTDYQVKAPVKVPGGEISCICTRQDASYAYFCQSPSKDSFYPLVIKQATLANGSFTDITPLSLQGLTEKMGGMEYLVYAISCNENTNELYVRCEGVSTPGTTDTPVDFDGIIIIDTTTGKYKNSFDLRDNGVTENPDPYIIIPPCINDDGTVYTAPFTVEDGKSVEIMAFYSGTDTPDAPITVKESAEHNDYICNMLMDNTNHTLFVIYNSGPANAMQSMIKYYDTISTTMYDGQVFDKHINAMSPMAINEDKQRLYFPYNIDSGQVDVVDVISPENLVPLSPLQFPLPEDYKITNLLVSNIGDVIISATSAVYTPPQLPQPPCYVYIIRGKDITD